VSAAGSPAAPGPAPAAAGAAPAGLIDALGDGTAVTRADGTVSYCSGALAALVGRATTAICGAPIYELFEPALRPGLEALHATVRDGAPVGRARVRGRAAQGEAFVASVVLRPLGPAHGVSWSIALDPGVAEERRTAAAPGPADAPLAELALRGTDIGLWDWNIASDEVRWLNDWCQRLGISAFDGKDHERLWTANIHPDDLPRYREALARHCDGSAEVFATEYRLRLPGGAWLWIEERGRVVERDAGGAAARMVGLCLNASQRRGAVQALADSEMRLEFAVWSTQVGFWDYDVAADEVHWWNDWCARHDLDPCAGPGHRRQWHARVHPDDRERLTGFVPMLAGSADDYLAEYRLCMHDGSWRWVQERGRVTARDPEGRVTRVAGVTVDVDRSKRAELRLRESESRLEAALWGTGVGLWEGDDERGDFRWFDDWCRRCDIDPCEGDDRYPRWRAQVHPDDVARYERETDAANLSSTDHYAIEYRVRTVSGNWRWLHERAKVTERHADGRPARYVGLCIDIDAHKQLEVALSDAKARYELAVNAARLPVWEYDVGADRVTGNVFWHRVQGLELSEAEAARRTESWDGNVHPADIGAMRAMFASDGAPADGFYEGEYRIRTRSGEYKWLLDRARVVERDAGGRPVRLAGIALDIDARKRMEISLRDSEARLEAAVGGSDIGLWDFDIASESLRWLSGWPAYYGMRESSGPGARREWLGRVHPDDRERLLAANQTSVDAGPDLHAGDYRVLSTGGEWRWVHVRKCVVERDAGGRAVRMVGACIDVDARRRAEDLAGTQAAILEAMREGVALIDLEGRIELASPAFERMFGADPGTLHGRTAASLLIGRGTSLPSAERRLAWLVDREGPREAVLRRLNGEEFTGEIAARTLVRGDSPKWLAVVEDVTERKALEREVLEIADRERHRLGTDLHDGLGQELTGIALLLRGLATRLERAGLPAAAEIEDIVGLVNDAIDSARAMARGLAPVTLDHDGLVSALRTLIARAREASGVEVRLVTAMPAEFPVDSAVANHLYRIAQEAINNALKHADARVVIVRLAATQDSVRLSVTDDGKGLAGRTRAEGMGLRIMEYRAHLVGGMLEIATPRGRGTRVRCVAPRGAAAAAARAASGA
jgi:PAS domain S-box-containing protein